MNKAQLIGRKHNSGLNRRATTEGFATLEILIAFAVIILCISAVIMVAFSNQSIAVDLETNNEATSKAQALLEKARADSREDFNSVNSSNETEMSGSLEFIKNLEVTDLTQCKKQAISIITWNTGPRTLTTTFSTFLSDITGALMVGGDCDDTPITEWDNPRTAVSVGLGGSGGTDIDVRNSIIYLASSPSAPAQEDLFLYNFDSKALVLTSLSEMNISTGVSALDTIDGYIFLANNENDKQLIVMDSSNLTSPLEIASSTLPEMTEGKPRSIYYYDEKVYIGTQYLPCVSCVSTQNNEFHVYDVSNPGNPIWLGSRDVNNNINDIIVRGSYAYLATSGDDREIIILNISNPANITQVGIFNAQDVPSGAGEDATSLYLLGNKLYFGRERAPSSRPDFYIIDVTNPATPLLVSSKNLGMNPGSGPANPRVTGIIVRGNLAFVGLDDPNFGLKIINISSPSLPYHYTCTSLNFSENSTGMDMEGNRIFVTSDSNDEIRVIEDQESTCPA